MKTTTAAHARVPLMLRAAACLAVLALVAASVTAQAPVAQQEGRALKIGIVGGGNMGGPLGIAWAQAGHQVLYSSRHPEELMDLVQAAAPRASAGYPDAALAFGDVILLAVPPSAIPQLGRDYGNLMRGKVVIDISNPREDRDGPLTNQWMAMGTGMAMAQYLPGVRLVKAFNAIAARALRDRAANGERLGVPIAGDDAQALATVATLVRDAGLDPVVVGPLARSKEFDRGTSVYVKGMTAREIREALGLPPGS
jgi:8-hydroxy-5-deazaflavin:NADPH oxidoreductase